MTARSRFNIASPLSYNANCNQRERSTTFIFSITGNESRKCSEPDRVRTEEHHRKIMTIPELISEKS